MWLDKNITERSRELYSVKKMDRGKIFDIKGVMTMANEGVGWNELIK